MKFNHMVTIAFTIVSDHPKGYDITNDMYRTALLKRIIDLDENNIWAEAVGLPEDTFEIESNHGE